VRIFSDLNKLKPNDKIDMTNSQGVRCVYNIVGSEIVSTGPNNGVSTETFNNLYFPEVKNNSILKIQTCVKGSTTKRLIYTAIME
jgi:sortase (surface protein transpeptidase)